MKGEEEVEENSAAAMKNAPDGHLRCLPWFSRPDALERSPITEKQLLVMMPTEQGHHPELSTQQIGCSASGTTGLPKAAIVAQSRLHRIAAFGYDPQGHNLELSPAVSLSR
ncbi:Hypothetical predicted protein [Podarcis lilfordi]|uniref:Uncharacterized protein n=1 Tax=Podarcis lilfordi TaxID=74358 RepID=A0AA35PQU8_9SAUR|nr:Hypothetical predicted protein [Podarcis lilfordi]